MLQLDEQYVKRSQLESELMAEKQDKDLETVKAELDTNMRELLEIQVGKWMISDHVSCACSCY